MDAAEKALTEMDSPVAIKGQLTLAKNKHIWRTRGQSAHATSGAARSFCID